MAQRLSIDGRVVWPKRFDERSRGHKTATRRSLVDRAIDDERNSINLLGDLP
jgi:hypothetical protein